MSKIEQVQMQWTFNQCVSGYTAPFQLHTGELGGWEICLNHRSNSTEERERKKTEQFWTTAKALET